MCLWYYQILHSSNHPTPAWDLALLNFIKIQETQKKKDNNTSINISRYITGMDVTKKVIIIYSVEEINFRINKKDDDLMLLVLWSMIVSSFFVDKKRIIKKRNCFGWVIKLQVHKACKLEHDQCMGITRWRSKNYSYLFTMSRKFNRDSRKTCFAGEMKHDNKLIKTMNSTSQYTSYTLLIMSLPSNPDMVQPKRVLERKPTLQYFHEGFFFLWQDQPCTYLVNNKLTIRTKNGLWKALINYIF